MDSDGTYSFDRLLLLKPAARTSAHFGWISLIQLSGLFLIVIAGLVGEGFDFEGVLLRGTGFLGWIACDYWYSIYIDRDSTILRTGQKLSDFELMTLDGNIFKKEKIQGHPVIYIFYRGNWCPL